MKLGKVYQDKFRLYLRSLEIWSLSELVMKELRVIVITEKVNSVAEDEKYVFTENFMERSFVENCHNGRKLWKTSGSI